MTFCSSFFLPQPNIEAQFLGMNADLVNLDLLGTAPVMAPQESSQGPSPANPFGLPATSSNSTASFGKPVGNPFESNKPAAPTLIQLAGGSTGFGGKLLFYPPSFLPLTLPSHSLLHLTSQSPLLPLTAVDPLQPPLIPVGTTTTDAGGSSIYPSLVPTSQPTSTNNQVFNPFS